MGKVMILNFVHRLTIVYICTKFRKNISRGFRVIWRTQKITKGNSSTKYVGRVTILVF